MIELTVRAKDKEELIVYFDMLKVLITDGYISGNMLSGWTLRELGPIV